MDNRGGAASLNYLVETTPCFLIYANYVRNFRFG